METQSVEAAAVRAYFELIELNMRSWRPEISAWLHSEASAEPLARLLAVVPCPPGIH